MPSTGGIVLGDRWFNNYIKMNNDFVELARSIQKRDLTYLDVMKDFTSEMTDLQCKIHTLLLLQDNASIFIPSAKDVREVIFYLKYIFNSKERHLSDPKLKCQLLASIVIILTTHRSLDEKLLFELMKEAKDFLLEIIKTKRRQKVIYSMACNCLEEIEHIFPGILLSEADALFAAFQSQKSAIFQSYASLLSLIVKNAVQMNAHNTESSSEQDKKSDGNKPQFIRSSSQDILDILPAAILVMDCVPFVTPITAYHIMKRLVQIVSDSPDFLPMMFKSYITRLIFTSDVPLFHLSFVMHKAFGSDLFTIQEEQSLLYQLVSLCCLPTITVSHRLLFMEWINDCLDKKGQKFSRWSLNANQFFEVNPFDGPDTLEKKLKLRASFSPQSDTSLLPVNTLQRFINPDISIRGSSSLFRTLFSYVNAQYNTSLMDQIQRFLLDLIQMSPDLANHILDLLQCVRLKHPESTFSEDMMFNLVQVVTAIPLQNTKQNLEVYLLILTKATIEKPEICKPKVILVFLKYILQNVPEVEDWFLGNSILAVCCSLMQHQSIDIFYSDIGEILFLMMKSKDVDVRVQAKIYYGLLTSLSSAKIQDVFQGHKQHIDSGQCLSGIATGNSSFHTAHPIQHLNTPILRLSRLPKLKYESDSPFSQDACMKSDPCDYAEEIEGYMEKYQDYLSQPDFILPVAFPLSLEFVDEADKKFQMLFGVVIKIQAMPLCGKLKDIELPIISRSSLKTGKTDGKICIEIYPEVPTPPCLEFRAEFTCQDGRSYQCDIPSISMHFEDLFLPLPVFLPNCEELQDSVCRRKLFDALWTSISTNAYKGNYHKSGQQSACKLKLSNDQLHSVMTRWKKFRIISGSNGDYNCTSEFGIFVPKCCHILMKVTQLRDFVTINVVTDDYKVLPLLESYLHCLPTIDMEL